MTPTSALSSATETAEPLGELRLPLALLSRYLFFLSRRPVSSSNFHYLQSRLDGLKSLRGALEADPSPVVADVIRRLETLHPPSFKRLAPSLELALLPVFKADSGLPRDVVVEDGPPRPDWIARLRRVLLVFGPGIGIGDELIFAPMPRWLRARKGDLEISTLSGYGNLWNRLYPDGRAFTYSTHREILGCLRGEPPFDGYDLVVFADFEAPELYRSIAAEGRLPLYLEISLGSRSAFLVDNRRRWLHRLHHITPYFENYYFALDHLLRALGISPVERFAPQIGGPPAGRDGGSTIFVSPFTSKYDPSKGYWGRLIQGVAPERGKVVNFVLDTGKNASTRRFAADLAKAVERRLPPGCTIRLAAPDEGSNLSLGGVFDQLDASDMVICADSFAAHAGPLFGCAVLVVAKRGLEPWRAPYRRSFYFDGDKPVRETAASMRALAEDLSGGVGSAQAAARVTRAEARLGELTAELDRSFERVSESSNGASALPLRQYAELVRLHQAVAKSTRPLQDGHAALFRDSFAERPVRPPAAPDETAAAPLALHLRDQFERWKNTNLAKYLQTFCADVVPAEREAGDD